MKKNVLVSIIAAIAFLTTSCGKHKVSTFHKGINWKTSSLNFMIADDGQFVVIEFWGNGISEKVLYPEKIIILNPKNRVTTLQLINTMLLEIPSGKLPEVPLLFSKKEKKFELYVRSYGNYSINGQIYKEQDFIDKIEQLSKGMGGDQVNKPSCN